MTKIFEGIIILTTGFMAIKILGVLFQKFIKKKQGHLQAKVLNRIIQGFLQIALFVFALDYAGFNLKILLGAAGILTVALGFASQTSVSNFISGLFLMTERPFRPGDIIQIGDASGVVISVSLLSTNLRTLDNLLIRVPNETLMKSQITNITYFDIRRVDLNFYLTLQEDLENFERSLLNLTEQNPLILDEPRPVFIVENFKENHIQVQFSFWVQKENYLKTKNTFCNDMIKLFKTLNIQLPYQKILYQHRDSITNINPPIFTNSGQQS